MTNSDREFCIGEQLTFWCTMAVGSYEWTVTCFLDGTVGNGRITIGTDKTVEEFMLSASGVDAARMSSLQVTVFKGLIGESAVSCRESGITTGGLSDNITILGKSFYHTNYYSKIFQCYY